MEDYVTHLLEEIKREAIHYQGFQIISIFIGGGTPSILPANDIRRIVEALQENYRFTPNRGQHKCLEETKFGISQNRDAPYEVELSIEVNPGTVDQAKFEAYYQMGINRISIGLQSTNDDELRNLGRIHTYKEFSDTYQTALRVGFTNINIDIMSALPDQTLASYEDSLIKICELKPKHISAYSLIIEEGTPFYQMYEEKTRKTNGQLPDEDLEREMYLRTKEILSQYGYLRYEISNYALKGFECRHNEVYWRRGNYLGFGSAAASMVENTRWSNCGEDKHLLTMEEQMSEFMFLGLRMMTGISKRDFLENFLVPIEEVYGAEIQKLQKEGLITYNQSEDRVILTARGIDLSNYVFVEFI